MEEWCDLDLADLVFGHAAVSLIEKIGPVEAKRAKKKLRLTKRLQTIKISANTKGAKNNCSEPPHCH